MHVSVHLPVYICMYLCKHKKYTWSRTITTCKVHHMLESTFDSPYDATALCIM